MSTPGSPRIQWRLIQTALVCCRVSEERELTDMLSEESAVSRLLLAITAGVTISVCASAVCWVTNSDPLGALLPSPEQAAQ